jgi:hypothetical protein
MKIRAEARERTLHNKMDPIPYVERKSELCVAQQLQKHQDLIFLILYHIREVSLEEQQA